MILLCYLNCAIYSYQHIVDYICLISTLFTTKSTYTRVSSLESFAMSYRKSKILFLHNISVKLYTSLILSTVSVFQLDTLNLFLVQLDTPKKLDKSTPFQNIKLHRQPLQPPPPSLRPPHAHPSATLAPSHAAAPHPPPPLPRPHP